MGPLPPVSPPAKAGLLARFWSTEADEQNLLEKNQTQSHNIRRLAGYGALLLILTLYGAGVFSIGVFLGLVPGHQAIDADNWHIVVAVLAALFTVPTVLLLAIIRATAHEPEQAKGPESLHEALGQAALKLIDFIVEKAK